MATTSDDITPHVTLETLTDDWLDAVWTMLVRAYDAFGSASDVPQPHMEAIERLGVDAWMADCYPAILAGGRVTFMGEDVNELFEEALFRARLLICARDHGMSAAVLMKLRDGGAA